ncbi:Crp/Fnr family transcriptional regulator [Flammeovirga sp. EKP202]|uniref:Crp/Fnr family transcriptional regulator n=1 Tax=Flammeovirga sp. EKP202 TaxID=2770592 RepID=UPI00165F6635|nr:Crp/Fnr family transcriptional regulator [Flammeovirga sp. EKP202]MBD0404053.1 Crp/Fnr family transcriptional regulator [Flammeovirga sp. EKP202]
MFSSKPYLDINKLVKWNLEFDLGLTNKSVKKGDVFLKEGQPCKHLYYILKGFVRIYYLDLEGNQITHWFCADDAIITSPFSYVKGERNILYFEAMEDTELVLISASQLNTLIQHVPELGEGMRQMNAEFAMILSRRIMSIHTQTAEERYLNLMEQHPLLFQKAKLSQIASFLGITQQSLSRIRKNL